jgi:hypothetical protein
MCHYEGKNPMRAPTVKVKCIGCGATKEVCAGEIPKDEVPMCDSCFMPMVAVSAKSGTGRLRNG